MHSNQKKIVIAGGSGNLGQLLKNYFSKNKEYELIILTRDRKKMSNSTTRYVLWDGKTCGSWLEEINHAYAVINLAGKSINCRFTKANQEEIKSSRLETTQIIGEAIKKVKNPPEIWMNASGISIFPSDSLKKSEYDIPNINSFLGHLTQEWEEKVTENDLPFTRIVILRLSVVLQTRAGALKPLINLSKFRLGSRIGDGNQYFSWIHHKDFVRLIDWLIKNKIDGVIHASSPNPVQNRTLMQAIHQAKHHHYALPLPENIVRLGAMMIATEPDLIFSNLNIVSKRLEEEGFRFQYTDIHQALKEIS